LRAVGISINRLFIAYQDKLAAALDFGEETFAENSSHSPLGFAHKKFDLIYQTTHQP
jgi:hypothetical protein